MCVGGGDDNLGKYMDGANVYTQKKEAARRKVRDY